MASSAHEASDEICILLNTARESLLEAESLAESYNLRFSFDLAPKDNSDFDIGGEYDGEDGVWEAWMPSSAYC